MRRLAALNDRLDAEVPVLAKQALVPGVVVGVWHRGEELLVAQGTADLGTGAPMTTDTPWLLGSVTKVLTTTLVLRLVERGDLDLDERVVTYLPEFRLADVAAAQRLTIRQLLNHTSGIDADTLMPSQERGLHAVGSYVAALATRGTLFEPGEQVHYSNPGFCVAGRVAELVTGVPFGDLLAREVFAPAGMHAASTATDGTTRPGVATGSFPDPAAGVARRATMFALPECAAPAGATPIVTLGDVGAFARTHLRGGVAPDGTRVLSHDHVRLMQTVTRDMASPNVPPVGLGWWVVPIGHTTALWHSGGAPGATSNLVVIPEHDLAVASFANGAASALLHDAIAGAVVEELTGAPVALPATSVLYAAGPSVKYEGVYSGFQVRNHVRPDGDGLTIRPELLPVDADHARLAAGYLGGATSAPPVTMHAVADGLFAPSGLPDAALHGLCGRTAMASFHDVGIDGRPRYLHQRLRIARREP